MTGEPQPDEPVLGPPSALADREGVSFEAREVVEHQHHFDLYESIAGVVVVGVTDGDRILLRVHESEPYAVPPFATVEPGGD